MASGHEVINLEGCTDDELRTYATADNVHGLYRHIAQTLLYARECRLKGLIPKAQLLEASVDIAYKRLPKRLRW
jgi:hypothetical protein